MFASLYSKGTFNAHNFGNNSKVWTDVVDHFSLIKKAYDYHIVHYYLPHHSVNETTHPQDFLSLCLHISKGRHMGGEYVGKSYLSRSS